MTIYFTERGEKLGMTLGTFYKKNPLTVYIKDIGYDGEYFYELQGGDTWVKLEGVETSVIVEKENFSILNK
jgi:hypothetical protein